MGDRKGVLSAWFGVRMIALLVGVSFAVGSLALHRLRQADEFQLIYYASSLDVDRAFFHGAVLVILLVLAFPIAPRPLRSAAWAIMIAVLAGFFAAALILGIPALEGHYGVDDYDPPGLLSKVFYIAVNVALAALFGFLPGRWRQRISRMIDRLPVVTDLAAPLMVCERYLAAMAAWWLRIVRLIPLLALFLPLALVVFTNPKPPNAKPYLGPSTRFAWEANQFLYDVKVDRTGSVVWLSRRTELIRCDLGSGGQLSTPRLANEDGINQFAVLESERRLLAVTYLDGNDIIISYDMDSMKVVESLKIPISGQPPYGSTVTLFDSIDRVLWGVFENGLFVYRFGDDFATILPARFDGWITDAKYDRRTDSLFLVFYKYPVLAVYDARTLVLKDLVPLEGFGQRLSIDPSRRRLYVNITMQGRIVAFDLDDLRRLGEIQTMIGVRTVYVDANAGRFFVGGFFPYLEVYGAGDLRCVGRFEGPAWHRAGTVSADGRFLFFSTSQGLVMTDLSALFQSGAEHQFDRYDPFFDIVAQGSRFIGARMEKFRSEEIQTSELREILPVKVPLMSAGD